MYVRMRMYSDLFWIRMFIQIHDKNTSNPFALIMISDFIYIFMVIVLFIFILRGEDGIVILTLKSHSHKHILREKVNKQKRALIYQQLWSRYHGTQDLFRRGLEYAHLSSVHIYAVVVNLDGYKQMNGSSYIIYAYAK